MSGIKRTAADARFSRAIRERDEYTCQRCGSRHATNSPGLHSAHMFSRRCARCTSKRPTPHLCTRMDERNAMALCYGCHQHVDSHPVEKEALFRSKLGDEAFESLAALAHGKRSRLRTQQQEQADDDHGKAR